jgi:ADP-ribose pyrophosphatase
MQNLPVPPDQQLIEIQCASHQVLHGDFLQVMRDVVRLPDHTMATREYVVHPGAVMIIPLLEAEDGSLRLVMERQYRYPVKQVMLEFPAGKLDAGESSFRCAERELLEETGYRASYWVRAGQMHPVIAYSTEFIDIWFAKGLQAGQRQLDEGEFLELLTCTPSDLMDWCQRGLVTDAKTLTGVLWLQNYLSGAWPLEWQARQVLSDAVVPL